MHKKFSISKESTMERSRRWRRSRLERSWVERKIERCNKQQLLRSSSLSSAKGVPLSTDMRSPPVKRAVAIPLRPFNKPLLQPSSLLFWSFDGGYSCECALLAEGEEEEEEEEGEWHVKGKREGKRTPFHTSPRSSIPSSPLRRRRRRGRRQVSKKWRLRTFPPLPQCRSPWVSPIGGRQRRQSRVS